MEARTTLVPMIGRAFIATLFMACPALADACSVDAPKQVRSMVPDCAVASAFEASFGQRGLSAQSILLTGRRVVIQSGGPINKYEYLVFLANDDVSSQLAYDPQPLLRLRDAFEAALTGDVCQINGVADAVRGGASFFIHVRFLLPGENEASQNYGSRMADILIKSCEAP